MTDFIKSKIEWRNSIYKTYNNTKKVPIMPPILIQNKFETEFSIWNNFWCKELFLTIASISQRNLGVPKPQKLCDYLISSANFIQK